MGVDLHGLRLLQYAASKAPLGDVATLGRQNVHVNDAMLQEILGLAAEKRYGPYCEDMLLEQFGATSVASFDVSSYENATVLHDMNTPLDHYRQYDTVIDFGTLEHVFNLATALRNVAALCRVGGRIIHALPANNYNGHGFWQFSPELFFSLYSASNGFAETEVYIAQLDDVRNWWKAAAPVNGVRVEYTSASRSYVLAITRKQIADTTQNVQQSDYLVNWEQGAAPVAAPSGAARTAVHSTLKRMPFFWRFADVVLSKKNSHSDFQMHRLSASNRHYTKVPLTTLMLAAAAGSSR